MTTIAYILTGIIALGALLYLAAVGFLWAMNKALKDSMRRKNEIRV